MLRNQLHVKGSGHSAQQIKFAGEEAVCLTLRGLQVARAIVSYLDIVVQIVVVQAVQVSVGLMEEHMLRIFLELMKLLEIAFVQEGNRQIAVVANLKK